MLAKRTITAIILGSLVTISVIYLPPLGFNLLTLLIMILAAWEFSSLFKDWNHPTRISFLLILILVAISTQFAPWLYLPLLTMGVLWWLIAPYFLWSYSVVGRNYFTHLIWQGLLGVIVFVPCWLGLVMIREKFGPEFIFYLLAIVCVADIGAYFAGMLYGHHLLAPAISPKKTWEGLCGGMIAALIVAIITVFLLKFNLVRLDRVVFNFSGLSSASLLMLTVVTCLWSVIGDLFESMLKRLAGVKDSGALLPGHGGLYDRIDSLTAAIPIFALGILII